MHVKIINLLDLDMIGAWGFELVVYEFLVFFCRGITNWYSSLNLG